jgi:hypothetical protein
VPALLRWEAAGGTFILHRSGASSAWRVRALVTPRLASEELRSVLPGVPPRPVAAALPAVSPAWVSGEEGQSAFEAAVASAHGAVGVDVEWRPDEALLAAGGQAARGLKVQRQRLMANRSLAYLPTEACLQSAASLVQVAFGADAVFLVVSAQCLGALSVWCDASDCRSLPGSHADASRHVRGVARPAGQQDRDQGGFRPGGRSAAACAPSRRGHGCGPRA